MGAADTSRFFGPHPFLDATQGRINTRSVFEEYRRDSYKDRRALLTALDLSFSPRATAEAWLRAVRDAGLDVTPEDVEDPKSDWTARFSALPRELKGGFLFLAGDVHLHGETQSEAHWWLRLLPVPGSAPPKAVRAVSDRLGGVQGALRRLSEVWPGDRVTEATIKATYITEPHVWRSRFAVRSPQKAVKAASGTFKLDSVTAAWDVQRSKRGLKSVSITHLPKDKAVVCSVTLEASIEISENLLQAVDAKSWPAIQDILARAPGAEKALRKRSLRRTSGS